MKIIIEGNNPAEQRVEETIAAEAGICTEEPGDNCWLQLD